MASITAGVGFAVIDVRLTLLTGVAGAAVTLVATHCVVAQSAIATRAFYTLIDVNFTCLALPAFWADTGEALIVVRLLTLSSVLTGQRATGVQHILTCFTCVGE